MIPGIRHHRLGVVALFLCMLPATLALAADALAVRRAIEDLSATFPDRYSRGAEFLKRLDAATNDQERIALQREALLANPLVRDRPILFATRPQYINEHGTEETMYQSNEHNAHCFRGGGALKVLDVATGSVRPLIAVAAGIARDADVHFDGARVLFSMRRDAHDDYHLYEIGSDGSGLRQLTSAPRVSDIHPVYLPNGSILFSSTREPKYIPCQRNLMANLFVMDGDGANIHQIGHNTQFEGRSSVTPDGRVLYTRWEYVDKHFSSAYGLWTTNPDGTAQSLFYGGLAWQPGAIVDAQMIPGSQRAVCVFTSVHDLEWGALAIVDPARGSGGPGTVVQSWPADISAYQKNWNLVGRLDGGRYDSFMHLPPPRYQNPYPLADPATGGGAGKYFLCSRMLSAGDRRMGLFLVDVFGNEVLLHHEEPGCYEPIPLGPRPRPPVLPDRTDPAKEDGVFYITDVYRGPGMEVVPRGSVKALRIVEAPAKLTYPPRDHGDWSSPGDPESHHPTAMNWNHYNAKRILGTVPVEPDGSAHFTAPAGLFLYFQLLDANGMMVHSMRSGTTLQPGERAGCIGCHEYRGAPAPTAAAAALRRPPSVITPWLGPERRFSYAAEVQPVWNRHCVRCHDYGKEAGKKLNLSGDDGLVFNASYVALMARSPAIWSLPKAGDAMPLVASIGAGPVPPVPPLTWGSTRSRLIALLRGGHHDVKLAAEELDRVIAWIDLNAPYYPEEPDYYTANTYGRSPLDHPQLLQLGRWIAAAPGGRQWGWNSVTDYTGGQLTGLLQTGALPVNFTRPELSACLQAFASTNSPDYAQALGLIRAGREALALHPRADAPRFEPAGEDRRRLLFHEQRAQVEATVREARATGRKVYDSTAMSPGTK